MSLLEPTAAELQVTALKANIYAHYRDAKTVYENELKNFWKSGFGATPQNVAAALGTNGATWVDSVMNIRAYILAMNPSATITAPTYYGTITVNPDDTVTVDTVNPV